MPTVEEARALVARLGPAVDLLQDRPRAGDGGGLELARELAGQGARVFLDMKLLDIENTVERVVAQCRREPAPRSSPCTPRTARRCARRSPARPAPVSRCSASPCSPTSMPPIIREQGIDASPADLVARRAALAREAGCDGVVASGQEAARVRAIVGPRMAIVTPGHPAAPAARPATRRAWPRPSRRSRPAPTTSWSDARSARRTIPAAAAEVFTHQIEQGLAKRTDPQPG